jgi:hypothetical protein
VTVDAGSRNLRNPLTNLNERSSIILRHAEFRIRDLCSEPGEIAGTELPYSISLHYYHSVKYNIYFPRTIDTCFKHIAQSSETVPHFFSLSIMIPAFCLSPFFA